MACGVRRGWIFIVLGYLFLLCRGVRGVGNVMEEFVLLDRVFFVSGSEGSFIGFWGLSEESVYRYWCCKVG